VAGETEYLEKNLPQFHFKISAKTAVLLEPGPMQWESVWPLELLHPMGVT